MKRWSKNPLVNLVIGGIVVVAIQGIIGNQAYVMFIIATQWVSRSVSENAMPWIINLCFLVSLCGIYFYSWQNEKIHANTLKRAYDLHNLDESLLRNIACRRWTPLQKRIEAEKTIVKGILRDVRKIFEGQIHRAAILVPDAANEYLQCYSADNMPQESIDDMKFYIGPDPTKRKIETGVAGLAYLKGETLVGQLVRRDSQWICKDFPDYKKSLKDHPYPPYKSFICLPILGTNTNVRNSSTCYGIITFDSLADDTFNSKAIKEVLLVVARRVAAALILFENTSSRIR